MALKNPEQLKLLKKNRHKFNAQPVTVCGKRFPSKAQAARYIELRDRIKRKEIVDLRCEVPFTFKCKARYVADFTYYEKRNAATVLVVEDVKGVRTALYLRNKLMMMHEFGLIIREVSMDATAADALVQAAQHEGN